MNERKELGSAEMGEGLQENEEELHAVKCGIGSVKGWLELD